MSVFVATVDGKPGLGCVHLQRLCRVSMADAAGRWREGQKLEVSAIKVAGTRICLVNAGTMQLLLLNIERTKCCLHMFPCHPYW